MNRPSLHVGLVKAVHLLQLFSWHWLPSSLLAILTFIWHRSLMKSTYQLLSAHLRWPRRTIQNPQEPELGRPRSFDEKSNDLGFGSTWPALWQYSLHDCRSSVKKKTAHRLHFKRRGSSQIFFRTENSFSRACSGI